MRKEEEDEYLMDCQYEYIFAGHSDYYGLLSHHTGECVNTVAKEGIELSFRISDC